MNYSSRNQNADDLLNKNLKQRKIKFDRLWMLSLILIFRCITCKVREAFKIHSPTYKRPKYFWLLQYLPLKILKIYTKRVLCNACHTAEESK